MTAAKPRPLAVIREAECIGCVKCIQVCPVDAILGAAQHTHTVIASECIGCKLCLPACPVDCIELVPGLAVPESQELRLVQARKIRSRVEARTLRLNHLDPEETLAPLNLEQQTFLSTLLAKNKT